MPNDIACPNCGHHFELNESLKNEVEKELRNKMLDWQKKKETEFENQKLAIELNIKEKITEESALKIKALEAETFNKNKLLQELQKKELDFIRQQNEMEQRQKNIEVEKEKYFLEKSKEIENVIIRKEQELFDMKMKEKDTQMESLKKTIADLNRKSEQVSMQLQGETQERYLEEILKEIFPFDNIEEVAKGAEGADCVQIIRNNSGRECGKIIYESKRTKAWSNGWVDKLKANMRSRGADVAILVTQTFPKDMERFGEKDGIWICNFNEISSVSYLLIV